MNNLLKVALISEGRYGHNTIAHTAVICKAEETKSIFQRFFDCFNMDEPSPFGVLFHVEAVTALIHDFEDTDRLQTADDLDEDDPFCIKDPDEITWIWHNINEHLYNGGGVR